MWNQATPSSESEDLVFIDRPRTVIFSGIPMECSIKDIELFLSNLGEVDEFQIRRIVKGSPNLILSVAFSNPEIATNVCSISRHLFKGQIISCTMGSNDEADRQSLEILSNDNIDMESLFTQYRLLHSGQQNVNVEGYIFSIERMKFPDGKFVTWIIIANEQEGSTPALLKIHTYLEGFPSLSNIPDRNVKGIFVQLMNLDIMPAKPMYNPGSFTVDARFHDKSKIRLMDANFNITLADEIARKAFSIKMSTRFDAFKTPYDMSVKTNTAIYANILIKSGCQWSEDGEFCYYEGLCKVSKVTVLVFGFKSMGLLLDGFFAPNTNLHAYNVTTTVKTINRSKRLGIIIQWNSQIHVFTESVNSLL